jgi:hypothetical protein
VPNVLRKFIDVFKKEVVGRLPNFKSSNYTIPIIEGKEPLYSPLYALLARKLSVLRVYLKEAL